MDEWTRGKRQPPPPGANREGRWTRATVGGARAWWAGLGHCGRGQGEVGGAGLQWAGPGSRWAGLG